MGFSELVDDYVQTAGWNMDALFIPQDYPAREMQDTFYLDDPKSIDLDIELVKKWKAIHEDGGDTGRWVGPVHSRKKSHNVDFYERTRRSIRFSILQTIQTNHVECFGPSCVS